MTEPLTEAEINEIEADAFEGVQSAEDMRDVMSGKTLRLIATLRAEQSARTAAEAQRDRLAEALRGIEVKALDRLTHNNGTVWALTWNYVREEARAALAEIGTALPTTDWQPIESGGGRMIISGLEFDKGPARWVVIATLRDDGRWYEDEATSPLHPPTHCMPIPALPTGGDR